MVCSHPVSTSSTSGSWHFKWSHCKLRSATPWQCLLLSMARWPNVLHWNLLFSPLEFVLLRSSITSVRGCFWWVGLSEVALLPTCKDGWLFPHECLCGRNVFAHNQFTYIVLLCHGSRTNLGLYIFLSINAERCVIIKSHNFLLILYSPCMGFIATTNTPFT